MFCGNCGNVLADTSTVCDRCGTPLKRSYSTNTLNMPAVPAAVPESQHEAQSAPQPEQTQIFQAVQPEQEYEPQPESEYDEYECEDQSQYAADDGNMYSYDQPEQEYRSPLVLKTKRAWWKMFLLGIITLGIYPLMAQDKMVQELNITASRYDGKQTYSPTAACYLYLITFGIYYFVWEHKYANRLGAEIRRRGIKYKISAGHFWLLNILLFFTIVCPIIYMHKKIKATNLINKHFNETGI